MGNNSREFEWELDTSGALADVVKYVEDVQLKPYNKWIRDPLTGMVQVEIKPTDEDLTDFERVRTAILAELADIKTPFAGVCGRYVANREALGGYTMSINISAYARMTG